MMAIGETLRLLRARGFIRIATGTAAKRLFEGNLKVSAGNVPVRLEIEDWDFLAYPRIEIVQPPAFLPAAIPHVDSTGALCYFAPGSVVLDRFEPAGAIALCLDQAERTLESLLTNKRQRTLDVQDELLAYWAGGHNRTAALIGSVKRGALRATCAVVKFPNDRLSGVEIAVISESEDEVEQLARSVGGKVEIQQLSHCWILETSVPPVAPETRLPNTVGEVFQYLKRWDESLYKQFHRALDKDKEYLRFSRARVAIHSPVGWLGFEFKLDSAMRKGFARRPSEYCQYLHKKGSATPITRMVLSQFGSDFIHARNLNLPTLAGKRVTLIGCGSVGGYLAQALARLGAGSDGGKLRLIDPQDIEAENVGRHWVGMSSLCLPKAEAVARELRNHFPMSKFVPEMADVRDVERLFEADLVIDACGIEALSEFVNAIHCEREKTRAVPVLHVWVVGNGDAVQGLWVDDSRHGCYRCLRLPLGERYRQERFPVANKEPERRRLGCGDYLPYAVSAPMNAAALATEFVVDWLKGNPRPRFRLQTREGADVRKHKNQDIERLKDCPACNHGN
jgi:hypothetical protein